MAASFSSSLLNDIRNNAQGRIKNRMFAAADKSNTLLQELGAKLAKMCGGFILVGSTKDQGRAAQKVEREYQGDWYDLKDVVRLTIVVPYASMLWRSALIIREHCNARNGVGLVKDCETLAKEDPCGYSGHNFVVRLSNGEFGEIQVNTPEILYGKMKPDTFIKKFGLWKYLCIKHKYGLEGGFGHALYEVYRDKPNTLRGQQVARISQRYYDCFRHVKKPDELKAVREQLNAFKRHYGIHI